MTLLLDEARKRGVAMGSLWRNTHYGFTTNEEAAEALRLSGAHVTGCYNATGPSGWEVAFPVGTEAVQA